MGYGKPPVIFQPLQINGKVVPVDKPTFPPKKVECQTLGVPDAATAPPKKESVSDGASKPSTTAKAKVIEEHQEAQNSTEKIQEAKVVQETSNKTDFESSRKKDGWE